MKYNDILPLGKALILIALVSGCANPHFFPRSRPLFAGFSAENISIPAQHLLKKAKEDFQLARNNQEPVHAKYVETVAHGYSDARARVFQGEGYVLTIVGDATHLYASGHEIILESTITGGEPYRYDEVDIVAY